MALYWPAILDLDAEIIFAVPSFQWRNLAAKAAVVTVSVIGISMISSNPKRLYTGDTVRSVNYIGPYLVPDQSTIVEASRNVLSDLSTMDFGSMPNDGGGLLFDTQTYHEMISKDGDSARYFKKFVGSDDSLYGKFRYCLWLSKQEYKKAAENSIIHKRIEMVRSHRLKSDRDTTKELASLPYAFAEIRHKEAVSLLIPRHSSEDRRYLPFELVDSSVVVADSAISMPNAKMHEVALYASRMHLVWIATVCGKLENRYRYSNTLGWNTFPVPTLTETDKNELKSRAEAIMIARETHFPLTIAELYAPDLMPANLLQAHDDNDAVVERIYVGRRFRNDTERLEKMFELYSKMIFLENITRKPDVGKNIIKSRRAHAKEA